MVRWAEDRQTIRLSTCGHDDSMGRLKGGVTSELRPSFAAGCRRPISHYSMERGAALSAEQGTRIRSRTCRIVPALLVSALCLCPLSRIQAARRAGPHTGLFPAIA